MESGYELEIDNEYIMSPKDLCTIGFLDKMIDAGVRVLKIEGRARSAEYVREVSSCYEAVKAIEEGTFNKEKTDGWRPGSRLFLTGDSGMVITLARLWENGTQIMDPVQQKESLYR